MKKFNYETITFTTNEVKTKLVNQNINDKELETRIQNKLNEWNTEKILFDFTQFIENYKIDKDETLEELAYEIEKDINAESRIEKDINAESNIRTYRSEDEQIDYSYLIPIYTKVFNLK